MEHNEQLGYLSGLVESLVQDVGELKQDVRGNREAAIQWREKIEVTLAKVEKELNMYATIWKTLKFVGACAIALLTFKLGLIADLWATFKGVP